LADLGGRATVDRDLREPGGAERGADFAAAQVYQLDAERGSDRFAPVARARAAADDRELRDFGAGRAQRVEPVAEREGDTFERGLGQPLGRGLVVKVEVRAPHLRVVVRRALAREVREEYLRAAGGAGGLGAGEQVGGAGSSGQPRREIDARGGREVDRHLVPQPGQAVTERLRGALGAGPQLAG